MNHILNWVMTLSAPALLFLITGNGSSVAADDGARTNNETALIGRWDLTIQGANDVEMPSWLELSLKQEEWLARFVGRWGQARFFPEVTVKGDAIPFISPKEEEGSKTDLVFDGKLEGEALTGFAKGPDGTPWKWSGKRAPVLDAA